MEENLLNIKNLSVCIDSKSGYIYPVDDLSLSVKRGETLAIIGESGCGKSMTANAIMQLLPPDAYYTKGSSVNFASEELLDKSELHLRSIRGNDIAMVFQDPMTALNPVLTIGDQLSEIVSLKRKKNTNNINEEVTKDTIKQSCINLLSEVGLSDPSRQYESFPHQLSGGMRQRVVIAMALAANPKLLIADEPTTALDVTIQMQILWLLKKLQAKYTMSLILITHDLGVVAQVADRVAVMYAGYIVEVADMKSIITQARHPYSKMLLMAQPDLSKRETILATIKGFVPRLDKKFNLCRFKDRCPLADDKCQTENPQLEKLGGSSCSESLHSVRCWNHDKIETLKDNLLTEFNPVIHQSSNDEQALLSLKNVKVYFPVRKGLFKRTVAHVKAVDSISFNILPGETLALVGESGSGKTTIAKAIMGLVDYTGEIKTYEHLIQIIFQDPYSALNPKMMITDILQEGYQSIYNKNLTESELIELLEKVGLSENSLYRYPHEFSGGQRQRIAIARSLAVNPKILILDEPTSALDLSVQAQILNLLKKLQKEQGLSYFFITHDLSVVSYMADTVAVMYLGRIVEYGPVDNLIKNSKHPYTQSLLESIPDVNNTIDLATNIIKGEVPSLTKLPSGCYFRTRCPHAMDVCSQAYPDKYKISNLHETACFLYK